MGRFNWSPTGNDRSCPQDGTLAKCLVLRTILKKAPPNLLHVNSVFIFVSHFSVALFVLFLPNFWKFSVVFCNLLLSSFPECCIK